MTLKEDGGIMIIIKDEYKKREIPSAVALGNFDGVHLGHRRLIDELVSSRLDKTVYTFFDHPLNFLKGEGSVRVINTRCEKENIFEELGVDTLFYEDFERVRDYTPEKFVSEILVGTLNAKEVVCGENYRFGKGNFGNVDTLRSLLASYGVKLSVIPTVFCDGVQVSSSLIRREIEEGNVERAKKLLGRYYFISSTVVHGKALGRNLGFPTVNLELLENRCTLKYGVYYAKINIGGSCYPSAVNVGVRPTVDLDEKVNAEAHIIGFDGDLYGEKVRVEFVKRLRDEMKFSNLDELKGQIKKDTEECKRLFWER